jgi:hypothetical protein
MNTTWNEEYIIKNLKSELEIKVAGTEKNGIIDYIDRFGFFEGGGVNNVYRIDPFILHAILSGFIDSVSTC